MGRLQAALFMLVLLRGCDPARAQPDTLSLVWNAPTECPTKDELNDLVNALQGGRAAPNNSLHAQVLVRASPPGFEAELTLSARTTSETRRVSGASCVAVAEAVALIIALAMDPAPSEPAPAREVVPEALPRQHPLAISVSALVDARMLPRVAFGGEVALGFAKRPVIVEAAGAYLAAERGRVPERPSNGADFQLAHVGLRGCYSLFEGRWGLAPCVLGGIDWVFARGFGSARPRNATATTGEAGLGLRAHAALGRCHLRIIGDAVMPFTRLRFVIENGGEVYRTPSLTFRGLAGAELHF